jgi:hypothetical protein
MTIEEMTRKLEELRQGLAELEIQRLRQEGAILLMQELIKQAQQDDGE